MTMRNLLPARSQQKQLSPFPRWWSPWQKMDNKLKKSVSALQKCKEDDDDDLSIIYWGFKPLPKGHWIPWRIIYKNCACSEVKQVTWSGLKVCSPVGQPINIWPMLQQGLNVQDQEGKSCVDHDKQWLLQGLNAPMLSNATKAVVITQFLILWALFKLINL